MDVADQPARRVGQRGGQLQAYASHHVRCLRERSTRTSELTLQSGLGAPQPPFAAAVYCPEETAFNATFTSVLIGSSSGICNSGYAGRVTRTCMYNAETGQAYWSEPDGACSGAPRIVAAPPATCCHARSLTGDYRASTGYRRRDAALSCAAVVRDHATFPEFDPRGNDTYVHATSCELGYEAENPGEPTLLLCEAKGSYVGQVINPCVRTWLTARTTTPKRPKCQPLITVYAASRRSRLCGAAPTCTGKMCAARTEFGADWHETPSGEVAEGKCGAGYFPSTPLRRCDLGGKWEDGIVGECKRTSAVVAPRAATASFARLRLLHAFPATARTSGSTCRRGVRGGGYRGRQRL